MAKQKRLGTVWFGIFGELVARTLLVAPGIYTSNKKLLGTKGARTLLLAPQGTLAWLRVSLLGRRHTGVSPSQGIYLQLLGCLLSVPGPESLHKLQMVTVVYKQELRCRRFDDF